jgi:hypothetical protein
MILGNTHHNKASILKKCIINGPQRKRCGINFNRWEIRGVPKDGLGPGSLT